LLDGRYPPGGPWGGPDPEFIGPPGPWGEDPWDMPPGFFGPGPWGGPGWGDDF